MVVIFGIVVLGIGSTGTQIGPTASTDTLPGRLSDPCSILDGWSVTSDQPSHENTSAIASSCEYSSDSRKVKLILPALGSSVDEALAASDCKPFRRADAHGCTFDRPLGVDGSGTGLILARSDGTITRLSISGTPINNAELSQAIDLIVS